MPTPTREAPIQVPPQQIYGLAAVCGLADPIVLEQATPREDAATLLEVLFPDWSREQRDMLWDRGRIDAAALGQAERLDTWSWPICDMSPPDPKLRGQWSAFVCELEQAVQAWIRQVARP